MINKTIFGLTFLGIFILSSCTSGNIKLDNPTDKKVEFIVDGETHPVSSQASESISLDPGRHKVTIGNKKDFEFEVKEGGLLHPDQSVYLTWKILFGMEKFRKTELKEDTLELDSNRFFGDFTVYPDSNLYIEGKWDYQVDEALPESKELYANKDFMIKSKIFRQKDFIETYKKLSSGK